MISKQALMLQCVRKHTYKVSKMRILSRKMLTLI